MAKLIITKLDHDVPENFFDCGNPSINIQVRESYFPTLMQYCYAYQVMASDKIVGYYMIRFKTINMNKVPVEFQDYTSTLVNSCSALHIGYIAVDKKFQNKKIGTCILETIIARVKKMSEQSPITIITLDALKEKYSWYKKRGFVPFDEADLSTSEITIPMYVSCILNQKDVDNYGIE